MAAAQPVRGVSFRLQARELVADLDRAVVELLDVDRTAGLEQEAHAANRLRCSHGLRADGEKLQHPLFHRDPSLR